MNRTGAKNPAKRVLAMALTAVLAMGAMFALAGCGPNDEQAIRDGITQQLDILKNPTKETIEPLLGEADETTMKQLETYGVDLYELIGHAFRGFDYTIGDIKVDGNNATADLTITTIDISKTSQAALESISKDPAALEKVQKFYEDGDQKAAMQYVVGLVYDALDATTDTVTTDTTLKLTKTNGTWDVDKSSLNEIFAGMYGDLNM